MQNEKELVSWLQELQLEICKGLEELDGVGVFKTDQWIREEGGGGKSRILENGSIFEKGGVNFSHVFGKAPHFLFNEEQHSLLTNKGDESPDFSAAGVSIVIHPANPWVPIIHMNIRFFSLSNGVFWFGGGIDLTPHYYDEAQFRHFHSEIKKMCDKHHADFYPEFSAWADRYFFLSHRKETRGIGGIFFDRLLPDEKYSYSTIENFWKDTGKLFFPLYRDLVLKSRDRNFSAKEKQWQNIRRGRYVEFNLVYDKGTRFGLETGGRTESILMSLPTTASWYYDFQPEAGSEEEKTINFLQRKR
jgi:coproporphyrinogen III oxidase